MNTDSARPNSEKGTADRWAGENMRSWYIHTTRPASRVMTRMRLKMRGMMEPRRMKNRASAEGRGRTIMMGWEGKARWKEEPETKTGKQIRGALTIRLSNRHGRADIILFRFIAPKARSPMTTASEDTPIKPWHAVRRSKLHGNGVFAARKIPAGTRIIEYGGQRISARKRTAAIRPIRTTRSTPSSSPSARAA